MNRVYQQRGKPETVLNFLRIATGGGCHYLHVCSSNSMDKNSKAPFFGPRRRRVAPGLRSAISCRAPVRRCWAPRRRGLTLQAREVKK
jgi:hypothetical protein